MNKDINEALRCLRLRKSLCLLVRRMAADLAAQSHRFHRQRKRKWMQVIREAKVTA
ncbi:hypothetical protein ACTMU2_15155 [Cupriavidus basilensis]